MSTIQYFVDAKGAYLGAFDSPDDAPSGAVSVDTAPVDAGHTWNGSAWVDARSQAEKAAPIVLDATDFFVALLSEPLLDFSALAYSPRAWLLARVQESGLDAATKVLATALIETARVFHRQDPDRPGLMDAVAAILPRADAQPGGLTSSEVDEMFLRARGY